MKRALYRIEVASYTNERSSTGFQVLTIMAASIERAIDLAKAAHPSSEVIKAECDGVVDIVDDAKEPA